MPLNARVTTGGPTVAQRDITSLADVSVHHVGVIVRNIEKYLLTSLWEAHGDIVLDPLQGARLCLVGLYPGMSPCIELVEPTDETSPLWEALQRKTSFHHICLQVATAERADELIRQYRFLPVTDWKPAVLFGGRRVRFAYSRNRELVEFLSEEEPSGQQ